MARPALEVADIFVAHADSFLEKFGSAVSWARRCVLNKLIACRTSLLGGHVDRCDRCDYEKVSYNSCRNRHCPKCQATARAEWLEARARDLLDVEYFHVVFTVPPLASVGYKEDEAKEKGLKFAVKSNDLREWRSAKTYVEKAAYAKVLVEDDTGKILGAHLLGHGAPETIHLFAFAITYGVTADQLSNTVYAYPTFMSDVKFLI